MIPALFEHRNETAGRHHVLTIGNFDGVHRGHEHLLAQVVERARACSVSSAAITFDPLPVEVLRPDYRSHRLTTTKDRIRLIQNIGIDTVVVVRFSEQVASVQPTVFVEQMVEALHPVEIVVGADFAFGYRRSGTPELLHELGSQYGYQLQIIERVDRAGEEISSTRIRDHLQSGDVIGACRLLGHPYFVRGEVVVGFQRGRLLGFPTANLRLFDNLLPPADGIYAALTMNDASGELLPSMVYVGTRPTFDEGERAVEVNILDFNGDLYGVELVVLFADRVRGDQRFNTVEALIQQMNRDQITSREMLSNLPQGWPGEPLCTILGIEEGVRTRGD